MSSTTPVCPCNAENAAAHFSWSIDRWLATPDFFSLENRNPSEALCPQVIASLRELDDGADSLVNDLGQLFLGSTPELVAKLCVAFEKGNLKLTKRIVHQMRSSSANIGALRLADLSKKLEEFKGSAHCQEGANLVMEILAEHRLVENALRREMNFRI
jgi:HPt (histidine-containing phosphotransfer) domain-containing protein